jgi:hypothetical protein
MLTKNYLMKTFRNNINLLINLTLIFAFLFSVLSIDFNLNTYAQETGKINSKRGLIKFYSGSELSDPLLYVKYNYDCKNNTIEKINLGQRYSVDTKENVHQILEYPGYFEGGNEETWLHFENPKFPRNQTLFYYKNNSNQDKNYIVKELSSNNWYVRNTGNFNNDDKTDILWRNAVTGQNMIWFMDGARIIGSERLFTVNDFYWYPSGTGDLDADGLDEIVWRNHKTGENAVWSKKDNIWKGYFIQKVEDLSWSILGVAACNKDNPNEKSIIWYRSNVNNEDRMIASWSTQGDKFELKEGKYLVNLEEFELQQQTKLYSPLRAYTQR